MKLISKKVFTDSYCPLPEDTKQCISEECTSLALNKDPASRVYEVELVSGATGSVDWLWSLCLQQLP